MSARSRRPRFTHAALALSALTCVLALGFVMFKMSDAEHAGQDETQHAAERSASSHGSLQIESSSDSFLRDLDAAVARRRKRGEKSAAEIHAGWRARVSLPDLAEEVLRAYRAQGSCELVSSGYLDIRGDVWGALVRDRAAWVDIVTITAPADDGPASASVARLVPKEIPKEATR